MAHLAPPAARALRCSRAHARPSPRSRPLPRASPPDTPDAAAVARDAIPAEAPEDVRQLDSILRSGDWSSVQQAVRELAVTGALRPGTLAAARSVAAAAAARNADPSVVGSLNAVVRLLAATLDAIEALRPKAELVAGLAELDPSVDKEKCLELLAAAYAQGVDQVDLIEDLAAFVSSGDEQDALFVEAISNGSADLGDRSLEETMELRRVGRERMQGMLALAIGFGSDEEIAIVAP